MTEVDLATESSQFEANCALWMGTLSVCPSILISLGISARIFTISSRIRLADSFSSASPSSNSTCSPIVITTPRESIIARTASPSSCSCNNPCTSS